MSYLTLVVMLGTATLGFAAGVLGCFAVLRRRALLGDVFAHATLPGLCLAFLFMAARHFLGMLLGAFLTGLAGVVLLALLSGKTRTKEDALMAIVLSVFFGLGIVLSSVVQRMPGGGAKAGLETYIYGQAAGMVMRDLVAISLVSLAAIVAACLLYKEWQLLCFDSEFAAAQGWPVKLLDVLLIVVIAAIAAVGLPAVGVILVAAMLIIPAATARFWTHRLYIMLPLAGTLGALAGVIGTLISAGIVPGWLGLRWTSGKAWPTGPVIVLAASAFFVLSVLFAPRRGIVARAIVLLVRRWKMASDHLLRTVYEIVEDSLPELRPVSVGQVQALHRWSRFWAWLLVKYQARLGHICAFNNQLVLTEKGLQAARAVVRRHRLWELYLVNRARIAPDHVHRDADLMEHFLEEDMLSALEEQLQQLVGSDELQQPVSPHPLPKKQ